MVFLQQFAIQPRWWRGTQSGVVLPADFTVYADAQKYRITWE